MSDNSNNIAGAGNIKDFTITSNEGGKTADLSAVVVDYRYYESVLSNSYTSSAVIIETGNGGERKGTLDALPIRGGEESTISITDNNDHTLEVPLFVNRIRGGSPGTQKDMYILDFSSEEYLKNQQKRVTKRYEGKISDHVNSILSEVLEVSSNVDVDETTHDYNFVGNQKKPFYTCTWLAARAVPDEGVGDAAGFLFFQTRDGIHFKSIDKIFGEEVSDKKFIYNNTGTEPEEKDSNIISYTIESDTELHQNMVLGTYNNRRLYFDMYAMNYYFQDYSIEEQKGGAKNAARESEFVSKKFTEVPTRLMTNIFDIGTNPKGKGNEQLDNWKQDPENPNYKAEETMSQTIMRYNQLFTIKTNIIIPGDFSIKAGDLVECDFPELEEGNPKNTNKESGGIYMVAHVCHKLTPTECLTSLGLVRDSYGKKGGF